MKSSESKPKEQRKRRPSKATKAKEQLARLVAAVESRALSNNLIPGGADIADAGTRGNSRFRREAQLRARMCAFADIYNAAYALRHYQHGAILLRQQAVAKFCAVLVHELETTEDLEALIYAVADSITCSTHGLPWES